MFIKRSAFRYKAVEKCDAFFMRRSKFRRLIKDIKSLGNLAPNFIKFILLDYIQQIYLPIQEYQQKMIDLEQQRQLMKVHSMFTSQSEKEIKGKKRQSILDPLFRKFSGHLHRGKSSNKIDEQDEAQTQK